ncbi:MAG: hypothetical protein HYV07_01325 [Deltaproteobacteria bacterium]|nr:hypothetical protein [Deltaproteobacteria bacterium]
MTSSESAPSEPRSPALEVIDRYSPNLFRAKREGLEVTCVALTGSARDSAKGAAEIIHPNVLPVLEVLATPEGSVVVHEGAAGLPIFTLPALSITARAFVLRELSRALLETRSFRSDQFQCRSDRVFVTASGDVMILGLGLVESEPKASEIEALERLAKELLGDSAVGRSSTLEGIDRELGRIFFGQADGDPAAARLELSKETVRTLALRIERPNEGPPRPLAIPNGITSALEARALPVVPQPLAEDDRDSGRVPLAPVHGWLPGPVIVKTGREDRSPARFPDPSSLPDARASAIVRLPGPDVSAVSEAAQPDGRMASAQLHRLDAALWFLAGFLTALILVFVARP